MSKANKNRANETVEATETRRNLVRQRRQKLCKKRLEEKEVLVTKNAELTDNIRVDLKKSFIDDVVEVAKRCFASPTKKLKAEETK